MDTLNLNLTHITYIVKGYRKMVIITSNKIKGNFDDPISLTRILDTGFGQSGMWWSNF